MASFQIRALTHDEIQQHRQLYANNPDPYEARIVQRFPRYFEIAAIVEPVEFYVLRQRMVLGAFIDATIIGTVAVERTRFHADVDMREHWTRVWESIPEHELVEYNNWNESLRRTYIGAPTGSLTLHSLAVAPAHRRKGIANQLLEEAVNRLDAEEQNDLYAETVRKRWLISLFEKASFVTIRQTLSLSDLLEFGCWGSVLMQYKARRVAGVP